jgi:hypothetical protein
LNGWLSSFFSLIQSAPSEIRSIPIVPSYPKTQKDNEKKIKPEPTNQPNTNTNEQALPT